jgi:hypothetical protein
LLDAGAAAAASTDVDFSFLPLWGPPDIFTCTFSRFSIGVFFFNEKECVVLVNQWVWEERMCRPIIEEVNIKVYSSSFKNI